MFIPAEPLGLALGRELGQPPPSEEAGHPWELFRTNPWAPRMGP